MQISRITQAICNRTHAKIALKEDIQVDFSVLIRTENRLDGLHVAELLIVKARDTLEHQPRSLASTLRMRTAISPTLGSGSHRDSYFVLVSTHPHGIAVELLHDPKAFLGALYLSLKINVIACFKQY